MSRQLLAQAAREVGHGRKIARAALVNPAKQLHRPEALLTQLLTKGSQPVDVEVEQVDRHDVGTAHGRTRESGPRKGLEVTAYRIDAMVSSDRVQRE
jgi:hypothetical protein